MATKEQLLDQTLAQQQNPLVDQRMLEVPLLLVEQTLQKLLHDPAAFESKMSQMAGEAGKKSGNFYHDNALFYGNLFRAINGINGSQISGSSGTMTSGMGIIGESLQQVRNANSLLIEPDIAYHVWGFGNFSMIPADHFQPSDPSLFLLQLPKKVIGFGRWLIGQKNWIIKTLSDCYFRIGKTQAAFLLDLQPHHLTELPISKLNDKLDLPYHTSTYFRLLRNRSVKIVRPHVTRSFPITFLLPTREEIRAYYWIPTFNRVMRDELKWRTAGSDEDLSTLIRGVARRTIAKYREAAKIPPQLGRREAYNKGRDTPYRISLQIELFLQEDWSSKAVRDRHIAMPRR